METSITFGDDKKCKHSSIWVKITFDDNEMFNAFPTIMGHGRIDVSIEMYAETLSELLMQMREWLQSDPIFRKEIENYVFGEVKLTSVLDVNKQVRFTDRDDHEKMYQLNQEPMGEFNVELGNLLYIKK